MDVITRSVIPNLEDHTIQAFLMEWTNANLAISSLVSGEYLQLKNKNLINNQSK